MFCQGDNISHNIRTLYASIYFVNKYQFSKMKVCSFKWCKKNAKSNKGTAFFQYPKCADMSRIWKEYTGYERNAKYATVCELHFKPEDLGGLKRPHEDVCTVVGTCEKTFKAFMLLEEVSHSMVFPRMKIRTLRTLADFYPTIFNGEHFFSLPINNHRNRLIKKIIHQYLNMRLKHYYSEKNKENPGNRQMNSRVTIFRNE